MLVMPPACAGIWCQNRRAVAGNSILAGESCTATDALAIRKPPASGQRKVSALFAGPINVGETIPVGHIR